MRKRTLPKAKTTQKIKRERDPLPWRYCLLTLVCGFLLVGGFFLAARQHFSSIEFGIKNSKLKKQLEEVETEKRRLILEKEFALTPSEIKKAAKKLGLTDALNASVEAFQPNQPKIEKISAVKKEEKTVAELKQKPLVSNIVQVSPAKAEKSVKKDEKAAEIKEKIFSKTGR